MRMQRRLLFGNRKRGRGKESNHRCNNDNVVQLIVCSTKLTSPDGRFNMCKSTAGHPSRQRTSSMSPSRLASNRSDLMAIEKRTSLMGKISVSLSMLPSFSSSCPETPHNANGKDTAGSSSLCSRLRAMR